MKNKAFFLPTLAVGLALGTAWAVRGKFGHEQGAAWAGAIGALCLILVAKRTDWYHKAFRILMAAAFGWGISGVMSYGVIVGYGRGTDFLNVFYGLLMLFVLGILYGFLGGGLFGLALLDSKTIQVKWHSLVAEMVAFGLLIYAVLINQLEWFMTPPRSEMWAACLGACLALAWYIIRHQHHSALKVAVWSALGGGFGFAFGNFLQVIGSVSGLQFNFWNVMEYSIGFFGGIGMAYGTFTSSWPASDEQPQPRPNMIPILFVTLFVPFVVWEQSFVADRFDFILQGGGSESTIFLFKLLAIVAILIVAGETLVRNYSISRVNVTQDPYPGLKEFFLLYTGLYIFLSFLVTGVFVHPLEQYLYILNLIVILILISGPASSFEISESKPRLWLTVAVISVTVIALFAVIAMNSHEGMKGSQVRFGSQ
ncbi:MAG: hypothetical protein WD824_00410 [Cyclobacteriaceae bacterium]